MAYDPQEVLNATIPYEYSCIQQHIPEQEFRTYCAGVQQLYGGLTRTWTAKENSEWMVRNYTALKLTLGASLLLASLQYCAARNVQVAAPYLAYYGMFNAARAWVLTMPQQLWGAQGQLLTMTHEKVINVTVDVASNVRRDTGDWLGKLLRGAQGTRELFAYRFPGGGVSSATEHIVAPEDAIEAATVLVELA